MMVSKLNLLITVSFDTLGDSMQKIDESYRFPSLYIRNSRGITIKIDNRHAATNSTIYHI